MTAEPITIVIAREIPSQNKRDRWHWRDRSADRDTWAIMMRAAVRSLPRRPTVKMHVRIDSLRARLIEDDANLRGGAKGMVDSLVRLGFVHDDSNTWAHFDYHQQQAPKALRCTRIRIEPA